MALKLVGKGNKGVFYTLLAVGFVIITILGFVVQSRVKLRESIIVSETRINTMNSFVKDVQKDLARGMNIASSRALLAILQVETDKGIFVTDTKAAFEEALLNGTINGTIVGIIQNATIVNWTKRIKAQADKIGIGVDFNFYNLSVSHISPWDVQINATLEMNASDSKKTASWKLTKNLSTTISIKGLEDPVYIIKSYGRVPNIIKETDVDFSTLQNLIRHINNSFYIPSTSGPSYLMRLEGDLSSSDYGIESIINLNEFTQQQLQTYEKSNVDYVYFGNQSHTYCLVNETKDTSDFNWFRLDSGAEPLNHLDNYGMHCASS